MYVLESSSFQILHMELEKQLIQIIRQVNTNVHRQYYASWQLKKRYYKICPETLGTVFKRSSRLDKTVLLCNP